jgi:hypothetical protein
MSDLKNKLSLFFDNDRNNFSDKHHCKTVIPILVKDLTNVYSEQYNTFTTINKYNEYLASLNYGAFLYGQCVRRLSKFGIDSYDPISGVNKKHIHELICPNMPHLRSLIFDWDRTLSVFEGLYSIFPNVKDVLIEFNLADQVDISDVAEYYLGGCKRLKLLRKVWKLAHINKIPIYILSSNPSVGKHPTFFYQLLKSVKLGVPLKHIMFRGDRTKYEYIRDKLKVITSGH